MIEDCYCVCHNPVSSRAMCEHCQRAVEVAVAYRKYTQSDLNEAVRKAVIKELKRMWNKTQHMIIPEGAAQSLEAKYLSKRIKELEDETT